MEHCTRGTFRSRPPQCCLLRLVKNRRRSEPSSREAFMANVSSGSKESATDIGSLAAERQQVDERGRHTSAVSPVLDEHSYARLLADGLRAATKFGRVDVVLARAGFASPSKGCIRSRGGNPGSRSRAIAEPAGRLRARRRSRQRIDASSTCSSMSRRSTSSTLARPLR